MRNPPFVLVCCALFMGAIVPLAFTGCGAAPAGGGGSRDGADQVNDDITDEVTPGDTTGTAESDIDGDTDAEAQPVPHHDGCTSGAECDDGLFCTGTEICEIASGICQQGTSPCGAGEICDDDIDECIPLPVDELKVMAQTLEDRSLWLAQVLAVRADAVALNPALDDVMNELHALDDELAAMDRQVARIMDDVVDAHLRGSTAPMGLAVDALEEIRRASQGLVAVIDPFLDSISLGFTSPALFNAVEDIRRRVTAATFAVGLGYYRNYIPIRFVQFFVDESDILNNDVLQFNIDIVNEIFWPAKIRFILRESNAIASWHFVDLDLRDANGEYILDANGNRQPADYTWPDDPSRAPPIAGIHYPDRVSCPGFVPPAGGTETRYSAQMRAGTYCCPVGEVLVYINQGRSNGGQYPWYSRIIGMSADHMASPNHPYNRFVFAHEMGHYLGLPHTFPDHTPYSIDYDLARMVDCPDEGDPPAHQRRFYTTHANLVNPETGLTAELSLFWDMMFVPTCNDGTTAPGIYQLGFNFFNSREEAAQYEADLQPIEQWSNGRLYGQYDSCCGDVSDRVRLRLTVGAGCRGKEGDFSDCVCPARDFCTGDSAVAAFSRFGSTPDKIQLNVMSYGYKMADGSDAPVTMNEMAFLSESQLEQIDRVLTHDVQTKYFEGRWGLRPELGNCTGCHPLAGP